MRQSWKCITEEHFDNQQYVFPTQQADVLRLVHGAQKDNNVRRSLSSAAPSQRNAIHGVTLMYTLKKR